MIYYYHQGLPCCNARVATLFATYAFYSHLDI
uniref:Uncharacterized protein n=1 Tax=Heterorhabditis bacteriophora TaxID=37862 RepID=A0A1I7WM64_HETBA